MLIPRVNVLIDGGGNTASWVKRYIAGLGEFNKVFVFEPNPLFHSSYEGSDLTLIPKAIWTSNCKLPFYLSKDDRQVASSLLQEKLCKVNSQIVPYWHDQPIEVECVDFSEWLKENIKPSYDVILKLDIEGAEYDVLWKMIKDGTTGLVKKLFVEFHHDTVHSKKAEHDRLIKALEECRLPPNHWD